MNYHYIPRNDVVDSISLKKEWDLTKDAFDKLLAWLDSDRERAGQKYEEIRRRLMRFFEWQGCIYPEDQTDQTMNRVARKLDEGVEVLAADPYIYFSGVARNVLKEYWRYPEKGSAEVESLRDIEFDHEMYAESRRLEMERRLECLEDCLRRLSIEHQELITEYYKEEKQEKIKTRKRLAEKFGIPLNALRIRCCRIRDNLEQCITDCLKRLPVEMK